MKKKMFIAAMSFVIALVLLATASFAWYTLSVQPEVTMQVAMYTDRTLLLAQDENGQPGTFSQYLDLSQNFSGLAPLRPVSTADGVNWFLPAYDTETGNLKDVSEFILDNTLEHANISVTDAGGNTLTGDAYNAAERNGYYVYTDVWMKTEEDGAKVRLSVPAIYGTSAERHAGTVGQYGVTSEELQSAVYGTYVLGEPELDDNGTALAARQEQPETAIRVGFLVYQDEDTLETGSDGETLPFAVYEPNAGTRAGAAGMSYDYVVPNEDGDQTNTKTSYISGYDPTVSVAANGNYVITQPIALGEDGKGTLGSIAPENLIVQTSSAWDTTETVKTLSGQNGSSTRVTSNDVASFGQFLVTDGRFALTGEEGQNRVLTIEGDDADVDTAIAGSHVIVTLKKDTPIRVRIFVWIEGQDVDCWNDIAAGTCRINLELAGETVEGMEDPNPNPDPEPDPDPDPDPEPEPAVVLGTLNRDWLDSTAGIGESSITAVEFTKTVPSGYTKSWDASEEGSTREIIAYLTGTKVSIVVPADADRIYLPENSAYLFAYMSSCKEITGLDLVDTSNVTSMRYMFYNDNNLTTLDVSGFDTSQVTTMSNMFYRCWNLTTLDVSGFDTSKVTNMYCMFIRCWSLTALDVSGFDTSKLNNMSYMFADCSGLTTLDVSGFDTSKVTGMTHMFAGCSGLTTLDVSGFDTSKVTDMSGMFSCCNLTALDISGFDTSKVKGMTDMFSYSRALTTIYVSDSWSTAAVTDSARMFCDCTALTGGNGTGYNSSKTDKSYARIDGGTSNPGYFTAKTAN